MKSFALSIIKTYKRRNKAVKLIWKYVIYRLGMFAKYFKITIIFKKLFFNGISPTFQFASQN